MSQLSFSSFDASLMVRDAQGRYLLATADQILEAARQAIEYKMQRGASFSSPVAVKERQDRGVRLSMEQISQLKSTTAIFHDSDPAGELTPATSKLLSATGWKLLPAVKAGNVFPMKYSYQYSYEGAGRIVDQIDAALDDVKPTATPAAS